MGLSVNGYTDAGISHTMNNEDLMGPNIPSIAFIQVAVPVWSHA